MGTDVDAIGKGGREKEYTRLTPFLELAENGGRGTHYRLSMMLKLGVAYHVKTNFYITLDSDVFLKRHIKLDDLLPKGKALLQGLGKQQRDSWWQSSAAVLGADESGKCSWRDVGGGEFSIGVTPSILSTH